ncbi:uncharacterized protein LOC114712829 isoform X4 [Neltuma alba]|uniref:uncharacterized protein LOC114712829 isoform X4 n=1 Tax=Neltuma alba TaxID=207710 RepID=UPI0010A5222B|nr:uncharacterized protein LOC114712829 isoform X4 [Prosopis alba]
MNQSSSSSQPPLFTSCGDGKGVMKGRTCTNILPFLVITVAAIGRECQGRKTSQIFFLFSSSMRKREFIERFAAVLSHFCCDKV